MSRLSASTKSWKQSLGIKFVFPDPRGSPSTTFMENVVPALRRLRHPASKCQIHTSSMDALLMKPNALDALNHRHPLCTIFVSSRQPPCDKLGCPDRKARSKLERRPECRERWYRVGSRLGRMR